MDLGNFQHEISNAFLVVIAIISGTFQSSSPAKIISPIPAEVKVQTLQVTESLKPSSSSAVIKNEVIVSKKNLKEIENKINTEDTTQNLSTKNNLLDQKVNISPTIIITERILLPSLTLTPTSTPTPTVTPIPTVTKTKEVVLQIPSPAQTTTKNSLNADIIFNLINNHRKELGYTPFEKDEKLCELARYRGPQLEDEIFISGAIHKGLYDLNLPYQIIENMAGYSSEQQNFNWWMNSKIHRSAIEGNYKYSCGICNGNSCAQLFTNYTPKY